MNDDIWEFMRRISDSEEPERDIERYVGPEELGRAAEIGAGLARRVAILEVAIDRLFEALSRMPLPMPGPVALALQRLQLDRFPGAKLVDPRDAREATASYAIDEPPGVEVS